MGISGLSNLIEGGQMQDDETVQTDLPERDDDPAPVPNPDLPEDGDPDEVEPVPLDPGDFHNPQGEDTMDNAEQAEEPADLSDIEKEFDDD